MALDESMALVLSEVFGPTVQGEGPSIGRRCAFVRLGRCNLSCSWCDTPYTWDWNRFEPAAELTRTSAESLVERVLDMNVDSVVITGGEPLLQQRRLLPVFEALVAAGHRIEIETNGTIAPHARTVDLVAAFNVSPKLANAGLTVGQAIVVPALRELAVSAKATFKFVAAAVQDLEQVAEIAAAADLPDSSIWIMPLGSNAADVLAHQLLLADAVIERGWNLTTRLQVLLWGEERGR